MKKIIILIILISSLLKPNTLDTALAHQKNEQFNEAIICYEEIIHNTTIEDPNIHFNRGCCYLAIGNKEKAIESFSHVLKINPYIIPAKYNLGYTYKTFGDLDKAIEIYKEVIHDSPDYDPAHLALGFAYITQGDLKAGWLQHSRYLKQSGKNGDMLRTLLDNNNVAYKTILLRYEGGLGDTLNFIRYGQRLKNMGADIIVACQKPLIPLLSRCNYIDQLIPSDMPMPYYDADATLMSLPAIFNDTQESVPHTVPYIFADPSLITLWKERLSHDHNFKIGICWQVDVNNDKSKLPIARRGYPLESFTVLNDLKNVSFYSLQKYDGEEQITALNQSFKLHVFENLDDQSGPFMDTAALMHNMDLIITVDTAIAHLAGALGHNVWLLHPYATADWRWICGRSDSYWYPTMRIFKQQKPFDYKTVLEAVKMELLTLLQQK